MKMMSPINGNMKIACPNGHRYEVEPSRIDVFNGEVACFYSSRIDFCQQCEAPIQEGVEIDETLVSIGRD